MVRDEESGLWLPRSKRSSMWVPKRAPRFGAGFGGLGLRRGASSAPASSLSDLIAAKSPGWWYKLDDNVTSGSLADSSGNSRNAAIGMGGVTVQSSLVPDLAHSTRFGNTGSYGDFPADISVSGDFACLLVCSLPVLRAEQGWQCVPWGATSNNFFHFNNNRPTLTLGGGTIVEGNVLSGANTMTMILLLKSGSSWTLYHDGVSVDTGTYGTAFTITGIGAGFFGSYIGYVDGNHFAFWNDSYDLDAGDAADFWSAAQ